MQRARVGLSISASGRPHPATAVAPNATADTGDSRGELYNQGEATFAAGDSAQAAVWSRRAHERDLRWVKPLFKLELVSLNLGDIGGAKQWFDQVVETAPGSPEGAQATAILGSLP